MDPSLQSLLNRLEHLSGEFHVLRDGIQEAIKIADISPEMAVTRARKVLEYVIRDVYVRRINEPPGTRPLENLLQRLVKDGFFPDRLDAYANTIRKLGNVGTHSFAERVEVDDVYQSLAQLMPILEWYFEVERPEALDGRSAHPRAPPLADRYSDRFGLRLPAASPHLAVVPKGLRSFDAHDADFFLDLLPGPRDKDGLPESIRFWKNRIETDDDGTFQVGVIYGPSGCGKSSLVKAGLLPRLAGRVLTVYIEATADETETRLLKGLRKQCPDVPASSRLVDALTALRQGQYLPAGKQMLIVLDQFEQWLHARRGNQNAELTQALGQCDGEHVRCLVLVRDDFWLPLSRLMNDLDLGLVSGQNVALVDLFDPLHARNVLVAFGRAFGRLDESPSKEQESFLDQAIRGLAQDGRVISVRLALFAEMVKGRPWTPATLKAVGGAAGVGVSFLEETFSSAAASPRNRLHQDAARGVLTALLPEQGTDIKGNMRSYDELLEASECVGRPKEFDELLRILDGELRLIAPTDPVAKGDLRPAAGVGAPALDGGQPFPGRIPTVAPRYYQLTHDYLVPSLRDWLTRKQKETRRGRAELRLANRAALWNEKPENRHLPSLWEYLNIRLLTKGKTWTPVQRTMMRKAGRAHGVRSGIAAIVLVALILTGMTVSRQIEEKTQADYAASLVEQISAADIGEVPKIVDKLAGYRRWADPLLKQEDSRADAGPKQRLHVALALLPVDESKASFLRDQLLVVRPTQFPVVRDALILHKDTIIEPLWNVALDSKRDTQPRFQAASALATYAPDDPRWKQIGVLVAGHLVTLQASDLVAWREALRPAKSQLVGPLAAVYRNPSQERQQRSFATETLADYLADQPAALVDLLADAEQFQFQVIFAKLAANPTRAVPAAETQMEKRAGAMATEDEKERRAKQQANLAVALVRMGKTDNVWPLLKGPHPGPLPEGEGGWDLRCRSYIIHWIGPLGGDPQSIIKRLAEEPDVTIRRALVLTLGEFTEVLLPIAQRKPLIEKLLVVYENEPDAGLHGAAEWLLRKWGQGDRLAAVLTKFKSGGDHPNSPSPLTGEGLSQSVGKGAAAKQWFVNSRGQTFVIVDAGEFVMGSPASEPDRSPDETQHRVHIGRRLAISTTLVTKEQFAQFQHDHPEVAKMNTGQLVKTDDSPQMAMTWYEAAQYCNWLSEQEGIVKEQRCYEPNEKGVYDSGMKAKDNYLELSGYRLPTEAEWEYACRARTVTSRYYGLSETLLPRYAWYESNSQNRTWPVASLKPNDYGLFDMQGNAWQWCDDADISYPSGKVSEDSGSTKAVVESVGRVLRGGSFDNQQWLVRSADRNGVAPASRRLLIGFRPARTYP